MCHDNEEWYKIWRGIDLLFPNWHEEFDKFWPKHLKVSNIFTLMCSFWAKYILFELKKYSQIIYYDTEEGYKVWKKKLTCENDMRNLADFHSPQQGRIMENLKRKWGISPIWPEHSKISKMRSWIGSFDQTICLS